MRTSALPLVICLVLGVGWSLADADERETKPPRKFSIRGVVKDKQGHPVPWAGVAYRRKGSNNLWASTDQDGRFVLEGVPRKTIQLDVRFGGVPDDKPLPTGQGMRPHTSVQVMGGTQDLDVVLDEGETLLVRAKGIHFGPGVRAESDVAVIYVNGGPDPYFDARLFLTSSAGVQSWIPTTRDGALVFPRIKPGTPWILHIPFSQDLGKTLYTSGDSLKAGSMEIELEWGKPITGFVTGTRDSWFGTYSGPPYSGLVARRGPVEVRIYPDLDDGHGCFRFPPLASGAWEVSVFNLENERKRVAASATAEAGAEVILRTEPSQEGYKAARQIRQP